jgi:hypothetical protein
MSDDLSTANQSRMEQIAPHGGATRAEELHQNLSSGRKPPDVQQDLNRGRLSMDEIRQLQRHADSREVHQLLAGIPLTDAMSAVEVASPQEKTFLLLMLQQRLRNEMPRMSNRTMQMKLAQRFQHLQAG